MTEASFFSDRAQLLSLGIFRLDVYDFKYESALKAGLVPILHDLMVLRDRCLFEQWPNLRFNHGGEPLIMTNGDHLPMDRDGLRKVADDISHNLVRLAGDADVEFGMAIAAVMGDGILNMTRPFLRLPPPPLPPARFESICLTPHQEVRTLYDIINCLVYMATCPDPRVNANPDVTFHNCDGFTVYTLASQERLVFVRDSLSHLLGGLTTVTLGSACIQLMALLVDVLPEVRLGTSISTPERSRTNATSRHRGSRIQIVTRLSRASSTVRDGPRRKTPHRT